MTRAKRVLDFPKEEYEGRVLKAQELMRERGIDCLLLTQFENLYYFTGYITWLIRTSKHRPSIALLPASGNPVLIIPELEIPAAEMVTWSDDIRGWSSNYVSLWVDTLTELKVAGGTIGAELGEESSLGMPISDWENLKNRLPRARWADAQSLIYALRSIKSPREASYMRKAGEISSEACKAAWETLGNAMRNNKPVTEKDIFAAMASRMAEEGALLPGFINVRSGKAQGMMHNKYPTDRVIQKGDWLAMDYGAIYNNYNSDLIRVGSFGRPPAGWERYHSMQLDIAARIREMVRPGIAVKQLCQVKEDACKEYGLEVPWLGIGHCIGLNIHELPRINPDVDLVLKPGLCFTVEPGFSAEGNTFCIEDVVMVTENGHEVLTPGDRELFIA